MKDTEYIKHFTFFSELEDGDLQKIADISIERSYKKNMVVFMEGEPGEAFYYIKSGKVKVYRTYEDGKEHIIHIFGEGDVFGEATLFNNVPYPASASVYENAVIGVIKNKDLEALIGEAPDLALNMIRILARKLVFAQQKIRGLAFNDVFSRTAAQIFKLSEDYGVKTEKGIKIGIQLSRQELADMVGTTRETISRTISRFKKDKCILEEDDGLVIINEQKLRDWI